MSIVWAATLAGLEAVTASCAALNVAYFSARIASREPLPRRVAAFVLALVSLSALGESAILLSGAGADSAAWAIVRAVTFAGMGCMSALVLRAIGKD